MTSKGISFANPPINEVVLATYFDPPLAELQSQHIGLLWGKLREEFPVVQQQLPAGIPPDLILDLPFPMPRYWLIANDDAHLIQIQKNGFMFNWRQRGQDRYPGFLALKDQFDKHYRTFEDFLQSDVEDNEPNISRTELTYIDVIPQGSIWREPKDIDKVFPSFSMPFQNADVSDATFDCRIQFRPEDDITIAVRIRTVVAQEPDPHPILVLEMKASTLLGGVPKSQADVWFERAHDTISKLFVDVTSDDIQVNEWGRSNGGAN